VSKLCPSSAVAVCVALSSLLTVTPAPGLTVTLAGENLKSLIFTPLPATAVWVDEPLDFAELWELLAPPQPASSRAMEAMPANDLIDWWGCMRSFLSRSCCAFGRGVVPPGPLSAAVEPSGHVEDDAHCGEHQSDDQDEKCDSSSHLA
jgi:hypothetical protein